MLGMPDAEDILQADVQVKHQFQLLFFQRCSLVVVIVVIVERYRHDADFTSLCLQ